MNTYNRIVNQFGSPVFRSGMASLKKQESQTEGADITAMANVSAKMTNLNVSSSGKT